MKRCKLFRKLSVILCSVIIVFLTINANKKKTGKKIQIQKNVIKEIMKNYEFFKYFQIFKNYELLSNLSVISNSTNKAPKKINNKNKKGVKK